MARSIAIGDHNYGRAVPEFHTRGGAVAAKLPALIKLHKAGALDLPFSTLAVSILVSGVAGYLVIAFFLRYLQTRTLKPFVFYRLIFGIIVLVLAFLHVGVR